MSPAEIKRLLKEEMEEKLKGIDSVPCNKRNSFMSRFSSTGHSRNGKALVRDDTYYE